MLAATSKLGFLDNCSENYLNSLKAEGFWIEYT